MGFTKEQRIINSVTGTKKQDSQNSTSAISPEFVLPNNSGDHRKSIKRDDPVNDYDLVNKAYVDSLEGRCPVGTIVMWGGGTGAYIPTGWLLCDGAAYSRSESGAYYNLWVTIGLAFGVGDGVTTFNVPDFRGIFPRGAGTSGKLTNANGSAFTGVLGEYENDKMQGHYHTTNAWTGQASVFGSGSLAGGRIAATVTGAITDGTNGTTRTGAETNPANLGVNFIIKY